MAWLDAHWLFQLGWWEGEEVEALAGGVGGFGKCSRVGCPLTHVSAREQPMALRWLPLEARWLPLTAREETVGITIRSRARTQSQQLGRVAGVGAMTESWNHRRRRRRFQAVLHRLRSGPRFPAHSLPYYK